MSENDNISEDELKKIEEEVLRKKQEREEQLKKEIEAKIKREMEEERLKKEKENELQKLKEEKQAMEKLLKEKEENTQREIEQLKSQIGQSKAIHTQQPHQKTNDFNAATLTDDDMKDINEASLEAFLDSKGLKRSQWRGR